MLAILQHQGQAGAMSGRHRRHPERSAETEVLLGALHLGAIADRPAAAIGYGEQHLVELGFSLALQ